ncbi:hypothetical protein OG21DRAFT_1424220 [Imleria badia]|nr:hypothetical protein OG21DRAFT_1424220 [Imleria badia]
MASGSSISSPGPPSSLVAWTTAVHSPSGTSPTSVKRNSSFSIHPSSRSVPHHTFASLTNTPQPDDRVQAIHIAHDYALVVRIQSIEIYSTTPRPSLLAPRGAPIAYPLAQFKFQWRTDIVVLCAQHTPASTLPPPIHLLVRFGSIYPWPVNVLHHYRLLPNPGYILLTTEYNLPYDPRPCPTDTIGSPIRLFGQSAMALGRYGTVLWLDNHTEEWMGPSVRGQRLAGRVVKEVGDRGRCGSEGGTTDAEPTATNASDASMLFGVRDDDAWTRVAMEEEAGRIALGHGDGAITLLEY